MIDAHTHIHMDTAGNIFDNLNLSIIDRAKNNGVTDILNVFDISHHKDITKLNDVLQLSSMDLRIFACAGVHPNSVDNIDISIAKQLLIDLQHKLIAFGETGLDLYRQETNKSRQLDFLAMHCELGQMFNKPIVIHQRGCNIKDIIDIIKQFDISVMFHCCTFGPQDAELILSHNYSISFAGIITFDKTGEISKTLKMCPLDNILVETDAPFLAPVPFRGKPNESSFIVKTYEYIAGMLGIENLLLQTKIRNNFYQFFKINQISDI